MYSKQEAAQLKQEFWTQFGQYMRPIKSADEEDINWINYKTRFKHIKFHLDADNKIATIGICILHPDDGIRALFFEQLSQLKNMLHTTINEEWIWQETIVDKYGKKQSMAYTILNDVSIYDKTNWPKLISFFKPRLIALDSFWHKAHYAFEALS